MGYIVTGEMLNTILAAHSHHLFSVFSQVALNSDVVLCCRVSPRQKQEIVAMVKKAVSLILNQRNPTQSHYRSEMAQMMSA